MPGLYRPIVGRAGRKSALAPVSIRTANAEQTEPMSIPNSPTLPRSAWLPALGLLGTLAACSDGGDGPIGSGAGAGDAEVSRQIAEDIATLAPFEGIYDLTGNWRGDEGDAAFLIVRPPSDLGTSEVVLSDVDEVVNCRERARIGELVVDDAGGNDDVFLNDLFDFDSGIATLRANGDLQLTFTDGNDIDADQDRTERVSISGTRVGITEQDLPPDC